MSEKFRADPARANAAVAKIDDLSKLIIGFGDQFLDSFDNASEILGHDEFGRAAGRQLFNQTTQIHEGVLAFGQVTDAVPLMLRSQQAKVGKAQTDAIGAISEFGVYQGEGLPGKGGVHGK
ncbi:hypothetical protein [Actinomadura sp. DC4]|uniref:hypothetical protein n=1 Tax=Actinomadura sp. DC4 TaxID=3055069 RepID=UPI0025AF1595|nr:hypothetical protein [Actinomadura sp. DC4]MDN3354816.1 hypothetical protein [Actinomadura sp. DC4]